MAAIYSNGGNRWNIFGFNFTKKDALSSVYKISMMAIAEFILEDGFPSETGNSSKTKNSSRYKFG
jgi:hypothetical protein